MTGGWRFWLIVIGGWTTLAVVFAAGTSLTYISQNRDPLWGSALAFSLAQWWIWAALTPVVLVLARRFPLDAGRLATRLPVHLICGVLVAFVKVTIEGRVRQWLFGAPPYLLINNLVLQGVIYGAIVAAAHLIARYGRSQARAAETERRLDEARLQLLRTQLQPHFLFNALNAIAELVHEDPERADAMIGRLSDLLRSAIDADGRQEVTLGEDLALADAYLDIQRARFGERLVATHDVPEDCRTLLVPHFLLQPIVENAVQHGIARRADGGRVTLRARRSGERLVIEVDDDGPGWPGTTASPPAAGIGLANTRARLASMYGDHASFDLRRRPEGGVRATIALPAREGPSR